MSDWRRTRKIARLPGARLTADTVLASTLEKAKAGHVKNVLVVMEWEDGSVEADWSQMPNSMASFMAASVNLWILQILAGEVEVD